ncbi:MAG: hypothetical protein WBF35_15280 [Candidatus Acidiferrales bacterium]
MRSWRFASALALLALAAVVAARSQEANPAQPTRANELTLAGLRPGHDTFSEARRHYGQKFIADLADGTKQWRDPCTGHAIMLELGANEVIQSVTISAIASEAGACSGRHGDLLHEDQWQTGRGLHLGDSQDRVTLLYGDPGSSGPSVKGKHELELMYYAFDWAGSGVPQVMEVFCARDSGRVMEITLAYPSL